MKNIIWLILFFSLKNAPLIHAQALFSDFGAESGGMGQTQAAGQQAENIFGNVASLGFANNMQVVSGIKSQFGGMFNSVGFGVNLPTQIGNAAFSVMRFGDKIYSEQQISAAFAIKNEGVKIGFRSNLLQINALGIGSKFIPNFDVGVITQLSKNLWLGAYANNITQAGFQTQDFIQKLPSAISLGIRTLPVQNLTLQADLVKEVEHSVSFRAGCQYLLTPQLAVRTGIDSSTGSMHWGSSFTLKKMMVHYAMSNIPRLGNTHQVTLVFHFKSAKKKSDILTADEGK